MKKRLNNILQNLKPRIETAWYYLQWWAYCFTWFFKWVWYVGICNISEEVIAPFEARALFANGNNVFATSSPKTKAKAEPLTVIRYTFSSLTSPQSLGSMVIEADEWGMIRSATYQSIEEEQLQLTVVNGSLQPTADTSLPTLAEQGAKLTVFDSTNNENAKYLQIFCERVLLELQLLVIPGLQHSYIIVKEK